MPRHVTGSRCEAKSKVLYLYLLGRCGAPADTIQQSDCRHLCVRHLLDEEMYTEAIRIKVAVVLAAEKAALLDRLTCMMRSPAIEAVQQPEPWPAIYVYDDATRLVRSKTYKRQFNLRRGVAEKADAPRRSSPWLLLLK